MLGIELKYVLCQFLNSYVFYISITYIFSKMIFQAIVIKMKHLNNSVQIVIT